MQDGNGAEAVLDLSRFSLSYIFCWGMYIAENIPRFFTP